MTSYDDIVNNNTARRAELLGEAEGIVTRSAGDLVGDDARRFEDITREIGEVQARIDAAVEMRDRAAQCAAHPLAAGLGTSGALATRTVRIPDVTLTREQIVEAHAALMGGQAAQIETRAVTVGQLAPANDTVMPPVDWRREPTRVLGLTRGREVTTPSVTYYRQTAAAAAAAAVAEGQLKPESTPGWEPVTVPMSKLAHWVDVSKEALDDVDSFEQIVGREMVRGLIAVENTQAISGDGTPPNMTGILLTPSLGSYAPATPEAAYVSILAAITQLRTGAAFATPDRVVLHPVDYQAIASTATQAGELVVQRDPTGAAPATIWGVPITLTTGLPPGVALVGDFAGSCEVYWRSTPTIFADPYSQSSRNLTRIVVEERVALAVTRPAGVCKVTFDTE